MSDRRRGGSALQERIARMRAMAQERRQDDRGGGPVPGLNGVRFGRDVASAARTGAESSARFHSGNPSDMVNHPAVAFGRSQAGIDGLAGSAIEGIQGDVFARLAEQGITRGPDGTWRITGSQQRGGDVPQPGLGGVPQTSKNGALAARAQQITPASQSIPASTTAPPGRAGGPITPVSPPTNQQPPINVAPPTTPPALQNGATQTLGRGQTVQGEVIGQGGQQPIENPATAGIAPAPTPAPAPATPIPGTTTITNTGKTVEGMNAAMNPTPAPAPAQPATGDLANYRGYMMDPSTLGRGQTEQGPVIGAGTGAADPNNPATAQQLPIMEGGERLGPDGKPLQTVQGGQPIPAPAPAQPPPQAVAPAPAPAPAASPTPYPAPGSPAATPASAGPATTPVVAPGSLPGSTTPSRPGEVKFPSGFPFNDRTNGLNGLGSSIESTVKSKIAGIQNQAAAPFGGFENLGDRIAAMAQGGGQQGLASGDLAGGTPSSLGGTITEIMGAVRSAMPGNAEASQPQPQAPGAAQTTMPSAMPAAPGAAQGIVAPPGKVNPTAGTDSSGYETGSGIPMNVIDSFIRLETGGQFEANMGQTNCSVRPESGCLALNTGIFESTASSYGLDFGRITSDPAYAKYAVGVVVSNIANSDAGEWGGQPGQTVYEAGGWEAVSRVYFGGDINGGFVDEQGRSGGTYGSQFGQYLAEAGGAGAPLAEPGGTGAPAAAPAQQTGMMGYAAPGTDWTQEAAKYAAPTNPPGPAGDPTGVTVGAPTGAIRTDVIGFGTGGNWEDYNAYDPSFSQYGRQFGVDPAILKSMAIVEGGGAKGTPDNGWGNGMMQVQDNWSDEAAALGLPPLSTPEGQIAMAAAILGGAVQGTVPGDWEGNFRGVFFPADAEQRTGSGITADQYVNALNVLSGDVHAAEGTTAAPAPAPEQAIPGGLAPLPPGAEGTTIAPYPPFDPGAEGPSLAIPGTGTTVTGDEEGRLPVVAPTGAGTGPSGGVYNTVSTPATDSAGAPMLAPSGEPISIDDQGSTGWIGAIVAGGQDAYLAEGGYGFGEDVGAMCNGRPCYEDYENWNCGTCHTGTDIPTDGSQPFTATQEGTVVCSNGQSLDGSGTYSNGEGGAIGCTAYGSADTGKSGQVTVATEDGALLTYGHANEMYYAPGEPVAAGDTLGMSGNLNGYHVHAEVQLPIGEGGSYVLVDPNLYYGGAYCDQGFCP